MTETKFYKYHGAGNDFVLFPRLIKPEQISSKRAIEICDRHFGVGADGLLFICKSEKAAYKMRIINSDGTEPEMCGNGIRCFAKHLSDFGIVKGDEVWLESLAGLHLCKLYKKNDLVEEVEVSMGVPSFSASDIGIEGVDDFIKQPIKRDEHSFEATAVSMGNPHLVIFEPKNISETKKIGPIFESHEKFINHTNVEFVEQTGEQSLKVVVYERGAGITLACGTGACAVAAAAIKEGRVDSKKPTLIELPGGTLTITFDEETGEAWMQGPAKKVYEGLITL